MGKQSHRKKLGDTGVSMTESLNCGKCNKKFARAEYKILCSGPCNRWICEGCTTLKKDQIKELAKNNTNWNCSECTKNRRKSILLVENEEEESESEKEEQEEITMGILMREMKKQQKKISQKMDHFQDEIRESLQFLSDSFDALKEENTKLRKNFEDQTKELKNANIRIRALETQVEIIEQEKREKHIVLMNVPIQKQEKTKDLVTNILKYIKPDINPEEYESKRVSIKENSPIIVKFKDLTLKNQIVHMKKEKGIVRLNSCGYTQGNIVYFNEDISKYKQAIFNRARKLKKDLNYEYVWIKNGNIYLRKNEKSPPILIKHEEDLNNLC